MGLRVVRGLKAIRRFSVKTIAIVSGVLAALISSLTLAMAGGWATITLDEEVGAIQAGETYEVGFLVKQHGVEPVNEAVGAPLNPRIVVTNLETGQEIIFDAEQAGEVGHFVAEVEFPEEGNWEWGFYTSNLEVTTQFEDLTVSAADENGNSNVMWLALALPAAGAVVVGAMAVWRRHTS
jgi:hypothetical protein